MKNTENINDEKVYELLCIISEGGKRGHQASEELWWLCYHDYLEIAKRYPEVYAPMMVLCTTILI